ncbi:hypothetical protein IWX46DRAFT_382734 [Phyllosticta citricarpa]|uniref:Secreted protein n=1 Tax=Phyllosticta citricarpa TaxID=55181 RepID=A0ABR1MLU6_9PEZI
MSPNAKYRLSCFVSFCLAIHPCQRVCACERASKSCHDSCTPSIYPSFHLLIWQVGRQTCRYPHLPCRAVTGADLLHLINIDQFCLD